MPELPEVEILCRRLSERLAGETLERAELASVSALKTFDPPLEALVGSQLTGAERRGKYVCVAGDGPYLVVHLARSGWVRWHRSVPASRLSHGRSPIALRVRLLSGAGFDLTEMATEKRLGIWVASSPEDVEGVASLGVDPLAPEFTEELLARLLAGEKGDLKHALSRQSLVAGLGNAYSDEALHAARLSPFKSAAKLSAEETHRLHGAITATLAEALERAALLDMDELKDSKRSFLRVHGRTGTPCPACGDTVREVSFASRSLQYCPTCQTGGKVLADRRLSRLLR